MLKSIAIAGLAALSVVALSAPAIADDPNDPAMRTAAARAKDKARIRQLNLQELERVRARDAAYAKDWQAYRDYYGDNPPPPRPCRKNRQGRCVN
jgi:hypothetical protein